VLQLQQGRTLVSESYSSNAITGRLNAGKRCKEGDVISKMGAVSPAGGEAIRRSTVLIATTAAGDAAANGQAPAQAGRPRTAPGHDRDHPNADAIVPGPMTGLVAVTGKIVARPATGYSVMNVSDRTNIERDQLHRRSSRLIASVRRARRLPMTLLDRSQQVPNPRNLKRLR